MHGLFMFLFLISILAGLYFLIRLIISFIKKDGTIKKYGKCLVTCVVVFIASVIGIAETTEPKALQSEPQATSTEIKGTNQETYQVKDTDYLLGEYNDGRKAYLQTDSVRDYQITRNGYWDGDKYDCLVNAVSPNTGQVEQISYSVNFSNGPLTYAVSKNGVNLYDRHTQKEFLDANPVERKLIEYIDAFRKQKEAKTIKEKQQPQATYNNSSNEVYVGTYSSGLKAYLLVDTLKMDTYRDFKVTIKAIDDKNVVYVDYDFSGSPGNPDTWRNSQGYSGKIDYDNPSVETNIRNYYIEKWSDYVVNYKPGNRK